MAEDAHIRRDKPGSTALRVHEHLVTICPQCRQEWDELGPLLRDVVRQQLATVQPPSFTEPHEPDLDHLSGAPEALSRLHEQAHELRHLRRTAKKELSELRHVPADLRPDKVRRAYRRFRSRQLAELLVDESRAMIRNSPAEAESFAALVPWVLDWTRGDPRLHWAPALLARAAAHRANALRVAGDLIAADQAFADLHRFVSAQQIGDIATHAELASLEASLRIDQHRSEHAEDLLRRASIAFQYTDDTEGQLRARIKSANLMLNLGRAEEALDAFEEAADLATNNSPYWTVCLVGGRANALCELDRPTEARQLLRRHLDAFEAVEGPHAAAVLRGLEGRVALGLGEYAAAEDYFQSACAAMLAADRAVDAALAALYLAETYHRQGRVQALRELAARLVPELGPRGLAGEALQALKLLTRAVAAEEVTLTLLGQLRRKLASTGPVRPLLLA